MTRSASRGTSEKSRTMRASRRPSGVAVGTAAHMPRSSWRRNSSTSALLLGGPRDVALRKQDLAVPGLHAQEPHDQRSMAGNGAAAARGRGFSRCQRRRARSARCGEAEHVDRARRRRRARAGRRATASPATRRAIARRLERRVPERELGGERRGVRAARAVRRAVGVTLAGDRDRPRRRR